MIESKINQTEGKQEQTIYLMPLQNRFKYAQTCKNYRNDRGNCPGINN